MVIADLSKAERELWEAFQRGEWADLRDTRPGHDDVAAPESWERGREVRAEVIRALLLGVAEAEPGCVPAVRLRGARVTGRLDLAGGSIPWPLTCECCHFDEEIVLADSSVRAVRIVDSWFPAFNGARMRVDGVVSLQGCSGAVAVRVDQARVVGEVCLKGAAFGQDTSAVAVKADGLSVDGDVSCAGLVTRGGVSMRGLHVTGSLDLTDAQVLQPGPLALAVGNASIGGRFIGRGLRVDGELLLHDTTVTRIELTGARLHNPGGLALSAGGLAVTGGMFCSGGFNAHGRIWLVGARLGANLSFAKSVLTNPGKEALKLDRATIGTFDGSDLRCSGQISAVGIRVASDMGLERATVDSGGHHAIDADGAVIDGSLRMAEMDARGEVSLRPGHVGQRLILTGARLENPAGIALALSRTEIASDLFCRDVTIIGEARLTGTQVSGHLDLDRARLVNPSGAALNAYGAQFGMLSLLPAEPIRGVVDLSHARLRILSDDPSRWPDDINLEGLTYDVLEPPLPARQRLRWLARDHHGHRLQPYEQLAAHYGALGQPAEARRILYARERLQRRKRTPTARTWSLLQDVTVAYGYQPWRALLWLVLLLTAGGILFGLNPPPPLQPDAAPHFNAFIYTLDLLLPVVDLGQKHAFNPSGAEQWFAYFLIGAGWVLATTVAAGAARVLSRR